MRKIKLPIYEKDCFLCFEFTIGEFTEEQIRICAEYWLDAKNCPNWKPIDVFIRRKKVVWV